MKRDNLTEIEIVPRSELERKDMKERIEQLEKRIEALEQRLRRLDDRTRGSALIGTLR